MAGADSGFFISFEGSEGCGKSTQISRLMAWLEEAGCSCLLVREPGGTPSGELIRHLLQHSQEGEALVPEAELLLFAASRAQLVREVILPALHRGSLVISDRFLDSTTVYQGVARRIPMASVDIINHFAAGPRLPNVTFLLDMDPVEAMQRALARPASADRMERLPTAFYHAVRDGYLALARSQPHRIRVLDATRAPDELAAEIRHHLTQHHALLQGSRA